MIELYTATTPNGRKASIALEELALPYTTHAMNLRALEQKEPPFLAINPNGRIPAIVDRDADDFAVFESGAILMYLAEKTGKLMPADAKGRSITIQWLMFQMGGLGPMQGQANVFRHYFPERIASVTARYVNETNRLYGVMDGVLADRAFLAGNEYTIADIACYPWIAQHAWSGIDLDQFTHLKCWYETLGARPAVQRGMEVPNIVRPVQERVATGASMIMT